MSHPNRIYNGDLSRDLNSWAVTGTAVHKPDQGNRELGSAHLQDTGDAISQSFSIGVGREYMLEVATKAVSAAGSLGLAIVDEDGDTIYSASIAISTAWSTWEQRVGLPWGNHTLKLTYDDQPVYIDDVSVAHVIKTRAELAGIVHDRLGVLATNASVTLLPVGSGEDGFYAEPIDIGLRAVGAVDRAGRPDVRYLDAGNLDSCVNEIELAALHKLHRHWATKTDYSIGPRTENQGQITAAIDRLIGTAVGGRSASSGRGVKVRRLIHRSDKGAY